MGLSAGTRLGPYEIQSAIGAGGMGEVYRALDTRLARAVAIKVLPAHFSSDSHRRERFQREARTISGLSHPNICALYDVGEQDGVHYLVLEYLEGGTLADRIAKGPLPVPEVLKIGAEIASALDVAHRNGIVHRDLKPGNVILTKSGAKLLDFGLAKPVALAAGAAFDVPTRSRSLTEEGMIVGTFQYMAPEQLEGADADSRSDIFALGTILYEMATGKHAFNGKTRASLIASILSSEPQPITELQPITPAALERVVRGCMDKNPEARLQSAHDVRWELESIADSSAAQPANRSPGLRALPWVAALLGVAVGLTAWLWPRPAAAPTVHAFFLPPAGHVFGRYVASLSPDGTKFAFRCWQGVSGAGSRNSLWLLDLSNGTSQPLPGTDNARAPFWSPDSRTLGFIQSGKLMRIDIGAASPAVIANLPPVGADEASWGRDGSIILSTRNLIFTVAATGGEVTQVLNDTASNRDLGPWFLPDGRHFLVLRMLPRPGHAGVYVLDLKSSAQTLVLEVASDIRFAYVGGYLFYTVGEALRVQRFDLRNLQLTGEPTQLTGTLDGMFAASDTGVLTYFAGRVAPLKLTWWSRDGKSLGDLSLPSQTSVPDWDNPRLSPDATSVAVSLTHEEHDEVWALNLARTVWTRLTFGENDTHAMLPIWAPDGQQLAFALRRGGTREIAARNSSGLGEQKILSAAPPGRSPTDWSRDGRYLIFQQFDSATHIGYLDRTTGKSSLLLNSAFDESSGRLSPDGHWLAYTGKESGQADVYVVSFPDPTTRVPVSVGGGSEPVWSRDGRELFYVSKGGVLAAVSITTSGQTLRVSQPQPLFPMPDAYLGGEPTYDVFPDGKKFLIVSQEKNVPPEPLTVITNWTVGRK